MNKQFQKQAKPQGANSTTQLSIPTKVILVLFFFSFFFSPLLSEAQFYQSRSRNYTPQNLNNQSEVQYLIMNDIYYRTCVLMEVEMTSGNGWNVSGSGGYTPYISFGGGYNQSRGRRFFASTYQCGQIVPKHGQRFYLLLRNGKRSRIFYWNDNINY